MSNIIEQWHGHNTDMEWYQLYKDTSLKVRISQNPNGLRGPIGSYKIRSFEKVDTTNESVADLGIMYNGNIGGYDVNLDDPLKFLRFYAGSMPITARQAFNLFQTKKQKVLEQ